MNKKKGEKGEFLFKKDKQRKTANSLPKTKEGHEMGSQKPNEWPKLWLRARAIQNHFSGNNRRKRISRPTPTATKTTTMGSTMKTQRRQALKQACDARENSSNRFKARPMHKKNQSQTTIQTTQSWHRSRSANSFINRNWTLRSHSTNSLPHNKNPVEARRQKPTNRTR